MVAFRTPPLAMTPLQLLRAINRGLPGSVRVLDCGPTCLGRHPAVSHSRHARGVLRYIPNTLIHTVQC